MNVYVVTSKRTGVIMGIYSTYVRAAKSWNINEYSIMEYPVLG